MADESAAHFPKLKTNVYLKDKYLSYLLHLFIYLREDKWRGEQGEWLTSSSSDVRCKFTQLNRIETY